MIDNVEPMKEDIGAEKENKPQIDGIIRLKWRQLSREEMARKHERLPQRQTEVNILKDDKRSGQRISSYKRKQALIVKSKNFDKAKEEINLFKKAAQNVEDNVDENFFSSISSRSSR